MVIGLSETLLLVSGGCLLFSSFALIHFASTYNPHNRSLGFLSTIIIGISNDHGNVGFTRAIANLFGSNYIGIVQDKPLNKSVGGRVVLVG